MIEHDRRTAIEALARTRDSIAESMSLRDELVVESRREGASVTAIAESAGLSRMQVHRVLNRDAPTLRLYGPDLDGYWSDSVGKRRNSAPTWLIAVEGSGSVRGWYFDRADAGAAKVNGEYVREVAHKADGGWE